MLTTRVPLGLPCRKRIPESVQNIRHISRADLWDCVEGTASPFMPIPSSRTAFLQERMSFSGWSMVPRQILKYACMVERGFFTLGTGAQLEQVIRLGGKAFALRLIFI